MSNLLLKKFNYSELHNKYIFIVTANILNITFSSITAITLFIHGGEIELKSHLSTISREDVNNCIDKNEFIIIQTSASNYYTKSKYFIRTSLNHLETCSKLFREVPELFFKQLEEDRKNLKL